jgi:phosphoglucosamine mutase
VLTALQVLAIMVRKGRPLDELAKAMEPLPQVLYNVKVKAKKNLSDISEIQHRIQAIERSLGQSGRLLIRYSGTEPLLRIMVEGENEAMLHQLGQELAALVKKNLGAG